jgi:hypothetical protein
MEGTWVEDDKRGETFILSPNPVVVQTVDGGAWKMVRVA